MAATLVMIGPALVNTLIFWPIVILLGHWIAFV
jgi:hypothetical protein